MVSCSTSSQALEEDGELFVDFITEPVDSDPDTVAQFLEVITWRFDFRPTSMPPNLNIEPSVTTTISTPTENKRAMPWCISDPRDEDGNLPVGTVLNPVDPFDYLPAGHTSCLIESRVHAGSSTSSSPRTFITGRHRLQHR